MFCSKCGFNNADGTSFCQQCGNNLLSSGTVNTDFQTAFQPQAKVPKSNVVRSSDPVLNSVKSMGASALFIIAIALFSVALFFDFINLFSGSYGLLGYVDLLSERIGIGYEISDLLAPFMSFTSVSSFIGMVPSILIAVGLWITFASAINKNSDGMKTSGLTVIKVINVIRLVFACVLLALIEILIIAGIIQSSNSYSGYGEAVNSVANAGISVLIIIDVLIVIGFAIAIIYYAKIISSINTIKNTINTKVASDKVSSFVVVMTFIIAGFTFISVFFSSGTLSTFSTLCETASLICFAVLITKYKNCMRAA